MVWWPYRLFLLLCRALFVFNLAHCVDAAPHLVLRSNATRPCVYSLAVVTLCVYESCRMH